MILRFKQDLCNTIFPARFERIDDKGNVEMIRLVQGTTEVIESKQDKNARQKDFRTGYANTREGNEVFYQVEITDQAIINYLKKSPYWGTYITEHDPELVSRKKEEAIMKDVAVLARVSDIKDQIEQLQMGYALLGNKALEYAKNNNYSELKVQLFLKAQQEPELVADLLDNPKKKDFLTMALAFAKNIVKEGDAGNSVVWGDENAVKICSVALGEKPIEALMNYIETQEGKEIRQMIGLKIQDAAKETAPKAKSVGKVPTKPTA